MRGYRSAPHRACETEAPSASGGHDLPGAARQAAHGRTRSCSQNRRGTHRTNLPPAVSARPSVEQGAGVARPSASDGGRGLSIYLLLAAAAAVAAQGQPQDPLAPLSTQPAPDQPVMVPVPETPRPSDQPNSAPTVTVGPAQPVTVVPPAVS